MLLILTPQLSINLAYQVILYIRDKAQRLIQKEKKLGTTPKAQDSIIQKAILLLYSEEFHAKKAQVTYIQRLIYNRINIVLIIQTGFSKSLII